MTVTIHYGPHFASGVYIDPRPRESNDEVKYETLFPYL